MHHPGSYRVLILLGLSLGLSLWVGSLNVDRTHFELNHWRINQVNSVGLDQVRVRLMVDSRSRELYDIEHIPGAIWLSEESWDETLPIFLRAWRPEHSVVIYCGGQACATSRRVALRLLGDLAEARVYVLKGGFPAWKAAQR